MEIVINKKYGGFDLSVLAIKELLQLKGKQGYFYDMEIIDKDIWYVKKQDNENGMFTTCFTKDFGTKINSKDVDDNYYFNVKSLDRTDADLIRVIKKLRERANTMVSSLEIIEIPDDVEWEIEEYDGNEWIAEKHRVWS